MPRTKTTTRKMPRRELLVMPPLLEEAFKDGPPYRLPLPEGRSWRRSTKTEQLWALYQVANGAALPQIGLALGFSGLSVRGWVARWHDDPELFFINHWVVWIDASDSRRYLCRYCGSRFKDKVTACEHAHSHIWDPKELRHVPRGYR